MSGISHTVYIASDLWYMCDEYRHNSHSFMHAWSNAHAHYYVHVQEHLGINDPYAICAHRIHSGVARPFSGAWCLSLAI